LQKQLTIFTYFYQFLGPPQHRYLPGDSLKKNNRRVKQQVADLSRPHLKAGGLQTICQFSLPEKQRLEHFNWFGKYSIGVTSSILGELTRICLLVLVHVDSLLLRVGYTHRDGKKISTTGEESQDVGLEPTI